MAKKEIYRLDIKIGVKDDDKAKKKLSATEKFIKRSQKRMRALNKIRASPSARLNDRLTRPLDKIESKINKVNRVTINPTARLNDKASSPISKIKNNAERLNNTKATATVKIKDTASGSIEKIKSKVSDFTKFARTKLLALATAGAVAIGGIGIGTSIQTFANFEQGMKNVQATSQATNEEFKQLWNTAKELGAKTSFSAKEASDGMNYLAMAGFKTNEIIEAMPGLLDLAAAAGSDLGITSDIVSDAITAFGLKAKDTTHLADVMAKASSTANTNVEMLGESFKYAAAPATAFGMSAEETTAALSMMANAGIKSSMAGTALRGALTRLTKPSDSAAIMMDKLGIKIANSKGKIKPFNQIMADTRKGLSKLTQAEKQSAIATIFGQEAMSGMLAVLNTSTSDFEKYTQMLKNADGTAKDMANMKLDSLSGQFTILKSAVEGMQIELGTRLAPYAKKFVTWFTNKIPDITDKIVDVVDKISSLATSFNNLNPQTKKFIGYLVLGVVTVGPIVKGINGIASGVSVMVGLGSKVGSFFKLFKGASTVAKTTTTVAKGAGVASKGIGLLGLSAKASALLLNPWTWGIGAATYAGVKLYKHLKKDSIPAIDLFNDKIVYGSKKIVDSTGNVSYEMTKTTKTISKGTKEAVGAYMSLDKKAYQTLMNLYVHTDVITKQNSKKLINTYNDMNTQIKQGIDKNYAERTKHLQEFFTNNNCISKNEQKEIIDNENKHHEFQKKIQDEHCNRILKIIEKARNDKRILTTEEMQEINNIQNTMKENAIKHLSDEEVQSKVILERLKSSSERLTTETASKAIENAEKQRKQSVEKAEKQYNDTVKNIIRMRDETCTITEDQAEKMIKAAENQKEQSIIKAQLLKDGVVAQIRQMNNETLENINTTDGSIKNKWDKLKEFFTNNPIMRTIKTIQDNNFTLNGGEPVDGVTGTSPSKKAKGTKISKKAKGTKISKKAKGTNFHTGGPVIAGEAGKELLEFPNGTIGLTNDYATLYNFPIGTKIIPNNKTEKILRGNNLTVEPKVKLSRDNNTYDEETEKSKPQFTIAQPQLAGAGGNATVNVDMNNNFNSNDDIDKIVQQAIQEFGYKLKEALKNTKK